jgi:DNA-binding SARP family transcriptional activator/tetratricopeptide (TPR) repeat protein
VRADDFQEAVGAALESGQLERAADLVETAAEAFHRGDVDLRVDVLEAWMDRLRPVSRDRPWLLYWQAWVHQSQGDLARADVALTAALALFATRPEGADKDRALALVQLARGVVAERDGRLDQARAELAAARRLLGWPAGVPSLVADADGDRWRALDPIGFATFWLEAACSFEAAGQFLPLARALHNLAEECLRRGEPVHAQRLATRACELKRSTAPAASYANSLNTLGVAERLLGSLYAATDDLEEALAVAERAGNRMIHSYALNNLAEVAADRGDWELAEERFARARTEKEALSDTFSLAYTLRSWSRCMRVRGDAEAALDMARRGSRLIAPCRDPDERALFNLTLGAALLATGHDEDAAAPLDDASRQAAASDAKMTLAGAWLQQAVMRRDPRLAADALELCQRHQMVTLVPEARLACRVLPHLSIPSALDNAIPAYRNDQQPVLRAWLLGEFQLRVGENVVSTEGWRSRRAAELLRLLTTYRHRWVHRDQLLEWLWPEQGEASLASLHAAVNTVRAVLGVAGGDRGWLRRQDLSYRLGPFASTDVDQFESLVASADKALRSGRRELAAARLGWALDIWRGSELLSDDRYAVWAEEERVRLRELAQESRVCQAELFLAMGAGELAGRRAREALAVDSCLERAHRVLIRAHLAANDRPAALRALEVCRRILHDELGVEPARETAQLVETRS